MSDTELVERLEGLERDNRRLKRGGFALLALLVALTTIYATRPVPDVIKAHEFEAVDGSGKVRVDMGISPPQVGMRGIALYDRSGNPVAGLTTMGLHGGRLSWLQISSPDSKNAATMGVLAGDPSINISDARGFRMVLGSTLTVTDQAGQTQDTSVDSIVMFGNDKQHHVIWQAP